MTDTTYNAILKDLEIRCPAVANLLPSDRYELQKALETAAQAVKPVSTSGDQVEGKAAADEMVTISRSVNIGGLTAGETAYNESRIAEIEARREAATPGPWATFSTAAGNVWVQVGGFASSFVAEPVTSLRRLFRMRGGLTEDRWDTQDLRWKQKEADAEFTAHSWTDIGYLLGVVKQLPGIGLARDMEEAVDNVREALGLESTHFLVIADQVADVVKERNELQSTVKQQQEEIERLREDYSAVDQYLQEIKTELGFRPNTALGLTLDRYKDNLTKPLLAEIGRLQRFDGKSRESGCWCDEHGHPCKACEDKQGLESELTRLRTENAGVVTSLAHVMICAGTPEDCEHCKEAASLCHTTADVELDDKD